MKQPPHLTPAEFELMEILWELGEGSVRDVQDRMDSRRKLAYTTVMTVLDKMRRKGFLTHRRKGRAYLYTPNLSRQTALDAVVDQVVDTYFEGSRRNLLRFLGRDTAPPRNPVIREHPAEVPLPEPSDTAGGSPRVDAAPDLEEYLL